jgi:hypothetical protein
MLTFYQLSLGLHITSYKECIIYCLLKGTEISRAAPEVQEFGHSQRSSYFSEYSNYTSSVLIKNQSHFDTVSRTKVEFKLPMCQAKEARDFSWYSGQAKG